MDSLPYACEAPHEVSACEAFANECMAFKVCKHDISEV